MIDPDFLRALADAPEIRCPEAPFALSQTLAAAVMTAGRDDIGPALVRYLGQGMAPPLERLMRLECIPREDWPGGPAALALAVSRSHGEPVMVTAELYGGGGGQDLYRLSVGEDAPSEEALGLLAELQRDCAVLHGLHEGHPLADTMRHRFLFECSARLSMGGEYFALARLAARSARTLRAPDGHRVLLCILFPDGEPETIGAVSAAGFEPAVGMGTAFRRLVANGLWT